MRLKKLEIEGFKSYANRVTISDFDASFNAITGFNGTGKSNVLDAICFVLGITNMSQVRASHIGDLIYKRGSAGITKASVTATFEHSDPHHKVPGYELGKDIVVRRQIVMGGRNTYTVNGSNKTANAVSDMFKTVGMNVNNPHFLIMQGRVGKVVNMSPKEVLAMVEEAVGVRIYETKRQESERQIARKDAKLNELNQRLDNDIMPLINRLTDERNLFLKAERLKVENEKIKTKLIAWEYMTADGGIQRYLDEADAKAEHAVRINQEIKEANARIAEVRAEIEAIEKERDGMIGSEKSAIDKELKERQVVLVNAEAAVDEAKGEKKRAIDEIKIQKTYIAKSQKELQTAEKKQSDLEKQVGNDVNALEQAQKDLDAAQKKLTALQKNMVTDDDGKEILLTDLVMQSNTEYSNVKANRDGASQRIKCIEDRLKGIERELATKGDTDTAALKADVARFTAQIAKLRGSLERLGYDEMREQELSAQINDASLKVNGLQRQVKSFTDNYPNFNFTYKLPHGAQVDESLIYDMLFKFFRVKDKKFYRAVGVAAGGLFKNVVVEKAEVASYLVHKNCLASRTTFIPLDRIRGDWPRPDILDKAKRKFNGEVYSINELIEYPPHYELAMRYAFGSVLVCPDRDSASYVANTLRMRAVSLIGDEFSPGGTASGGRSRDNYDNLLRDMEDYNRVSVEYKEASRELEDLKKEQMKQQDVGHEVQRIKEEIRLTQERVKAIEDQLKSTAVEMLKAEKEAYLAEKAQKMDELAALDAKLPELEAKIAKLRENQKDQAFIEKQKAETKKAKTAAQKKVEELSGSSGKKDELDRMKDQIEAIKSNIALSDKEIKDKEDGIALIETKLKELAAAVEAAKEAVEEQQSKHDDCLGKMAARDADVRDKHSEISATKKQVLELQNAVEQTAKEAETCRQHSKESANKASQLLRQFPFLKDAKQRFHTPGSEYDLTNFNYAEAKEKHAEKSNELQEISQNINPSAAERLEKFETNAKELEHKRTQLQNEKAKMYETLKAIDERKRNELKLAFVQVNVTFNEIFGMLLPGAQAKLVPIGPDENDLDRIEEGLRFRVAFNNLWKESLTELSGGQRSLIALSIILALLRFKPAPLYILDEVDAALDISHTSQIGAVIKNHFKSAQFIIVSLKPGMFKNATAIFRTRMQDGVSAVVRVNDDVGEDFENPEGTAAA